MTTESGRQRRLCTSVLCAAFLLAASACAHQDDSSAGSCARKESYGLGDYTRSVTQGAQMFTLSQAVPANAQLGMFSLKGSADGVTQVKIRLYEGGSTPEAGTLLLDTTTTEALEPDGDGDLELRFGRGVSVQPGMSYWFVFESVGAPLVLDTGCSGSGFDSGDGWEFLTDHWSRMYCDFSLGGGFDCY